MENAVRNWWDSTGVEREMRNHWSSFVAHAFGHHDQQALNDLLETTVSDSSVSNLASETTELGRETAALRPIHAHADISQECEPTSDVGEVVRNAGEARTMPAGIQSGPLSMVDRHRVGAIRCTLKRRHSEYVYELKHNSPRILLLGDSGLGKSRVVNKEFGFRPGYGESAEQIPGNSCSQNSVEFGPSDSVPAKILYCNKSGISAEAQVEELRGDIEEASSSPDELDHVHICWYFVAKEWGQVDQILVEELRMKCGVVIVLSRGEKRTRQWVRNTRAAITAELGAVETVVVGDSRGATNWVPGSCECGHSEELLRRCQGAALPSGHAELVRVSMGIIPCFLRQSFFFSQRVDLSLKNIRAASILSSCLASGSSVGACPVPFLDLPVLIARESTMAAEPIATCGLPLNVFGAEHIAGLYGSMIGASGSLWYFGGQILQSIPILQRAGAGVNSIVSDTTISTLGAAICVVLTKFLLTGNATTADRHKIGEDVASRIDARRAVLAAVSTGSRLSPATEQIFAQVIEENCSEDLALA